jgi:DNA invertase Pin-like site-specific DNA recombinase
VASTNGYGLRWAIPYARVSTDEQARSGYSLAQQLEALRECASREGYAVLEEVTDPGQSVVSLERPGMDRVRDLVATEEVSVVLAQDRDRFAREPAYHYLMRREFEEQGTKIRALNGRGVDSPEGELTDGILDQLAKFERAKTAERTRRGKLRRARECKVVPTHTPDYGFEFNGSRGNYVVVEAKMAVVRRIFCMIAVEGMTMHAVKKTFECGGRRGDPEREAKGWLDKLAEVDCKRSGFQEMAAEGLIAFDELRAKLAALDATRVTAERELEAIKGRREHLEKLERYKESLLETYAALTPEALESLTPEERQKLYKMLKLKAVINLDGSIEVGGMFVDNLDVCTAEVSS